MIYTLYAFLSIFKGIPEQSTAQVRAPLVNVKQKQQK